jgi:hypothetical protein
VRARSGSVPGTLWFGEDVPCSAVKVFRGDPGTLCPDQHWLRGAATIGTCSFGGAQYELTFGAAIRENTPESEPHQSYHGSRENRRIVRDTSTSVPSWSAACIPELLRGHGAETQFPIATRHTGVLMVNLANSYGLCRGSMS